MPHKIPKHIRDGYHDRVPAVTLQMVRRLGALVLLVGICIAVCAIPFVQLRKAELWSARFQFRVNDSGNMEYRQCHERGVHNYKDWGWPATIICCEVPRQFAGIEFSMPTSIDREIHLYLRSAGFPGVNTNLGNGFVFTDALNALDLTQEQRDEIQRLGVPGVERRLFWPGIIQRLLAVLLLPLIVFTLFCRVLPGILAAHRVYRARYVVDDDELRCPKCAQRLAHITPNCPECGEPIPGTQ